MWTEITSLVRILMFTVEKIVKIKPVWLFRLKDVLLLNIHWFFFLSFSYKHTGEGRLWSLVSVWIKDTVAWGQEELFACSSVSLGGNRKQTAVCGVKVLYASYFTWRVYHRGHRGQPTQKALFVSMWIEAAEIFANLDLIYNLNIHFYPTWDLQFSFIYFFYKHLTLFNRAEEKPLELLSN